MQRMQAPKETYDEKQSEELCSPGALNPTGDPEVLANQKKRAGFEGQEVPERKVLG